MLKPDGMEYFSLFREAAAVLRGFVDVNLLNTFAACVLQTACGHMCDCQLHTQNTDTLWAVFRTKLQLNKREIMSPVFIIHLRISIIFNQICRQANNH